MHNQATFNFMTKESEYDGWPYNISQTIEGNPYVLDANFRPKDWVLCVEGKRANKLKNGG